MVLITHSHFQAIFHGQIYFYTAGFELIGRGHGNLATLEQVPGTGAGGGWGGRSMSGRWLCSWLAA
jgi:hypothetical protein